MALATLPDDDVTVSGLFGRHRQGDGVSESQLTFTTADWDTAQTVTVTGIQDVDDDVENLDVTLSASSTDSDYHGEAVTVAVSVTDDDTPGLVAPERADGARGRHGGRSRSRWRRCPTMT